MFFDINKNLCATFTGLDPIRLLDYPAEDVFNLIGGLLDHNRRHDNDKPAKGSKSGVIRKAAGDSWF